MSWTVRNARYLLAVSVNRPAAQTDGARAGPPPSEGNITAHPARRGRRAASFGDLIEDSEAIQPGEAVSFTLPQEQLHSVLGTLSKREADVVSMRFGSTDVQPKTLDEIGRVDGVTREWIR